MNIEEKLTLITEALDADRANVKADTKLNSMDEWDSMGKISIIAMLDKKYNKTIDVEQLESLTTVQDILNLMQ